MTVVLDSWAVLAWLDGLEPAMRRVEAAIPERPTINWVNLAEVAYRLEREHGPAIADQTVADIRRVVTGDLPGTGRMLAAARVKATHPIALGDCFAIATATALGAELWTGDPEILDRAAQFECVVVDLR